MRLRFLAGVSASLLTGAAALFLVHCDDGENAPGTVPTNDASLTDSSASFDSSHPTTDASEDAGVDSGPVYDDAGCLVPSGPLPSLDDAGFPTTGLALWLRADRGLSTKTDGTVCHWDDQSGKGHSFPPTGASAPTLDPNGIRNAPAVKFVGDQHLGRPDVLGLAATSGRTVAVFSASTDTTTRLQNFLQGKGGTPGTYFGIDQSTFNGTPGLEGVYVTNNAFQTTVATTAEARSHVYSISNFAAGTSLSSVLTYAIDGTDEALTATSGGLGTGTVEDFSGADFTNIGSAGAGYTGGFIGEVIVWDHALDATERAAVNTHFQTHYPKP